MFCMSFLYVFGVCVGVVVLFVDVLLLDMFCVCVVCLFCLCVCVSFDLFVCVLFVVVFVCVWSFVVIDGVMDMDGWRMGLLALWI